MTHASVFVGGAILFALSVVVWWKWIDPWPDVKRAALDIAAGQTPRQFLFRGNRHAHVIGLALEQIHSRDRKRAAKINEGGFSLRTIVAEFLTAFSSSIRGGEFSR